MAQALQISQSGYYAWVNRVVTPGKQQDLKLVEQIKKYITDQKRSMAVQE